MTSRNDRIASLLAWSSIHHATLHPSAEIAYDSTTGLSLRVKPSSPSPIQPYEPIVRLPTALTLSYLNAVHPAPAAFHPAFLRDTPPHVVGRLFLVREYLKREESFWWPYIHLLPQPHPDDGGHSLGYHEDDDDVEWALPPFWPPEESELLEGTNLETGLEKIVADVNAEFAAAKALMESYPPEGDPSFTSRLTKRLYEWAYCIFSSRSFRPSLVLSPEQLALLPEGVSPESFSVLLPLFDIGNHDMTVPVKWLLTPTPNDGGATATPTATAATGTCCELQIGREHAPGQQIFNNYSPKTNAELLLGYNFIIPPTAALHNDYAHVRKHTNPSASANTPDSKNGNPAAAAAAAAAAATADEYLISLRPTSHPSSLLALSKQTLFIDPSPPLPRLLNSFQHVPHDMVWDIFLTLIQHSSQNISDLIPLDGPSSSSSSSSSTNQHKQQEQQEKARQEKFFSGAVDGLCKDLLVQTVAIIQHKLLQELERLDETDIEVIGDDEPLLSRNQALALQYRERCRDVLESVLAAMGEDEALLYDDDGDYDMEE